MIYETAGKYLEVATAIIYGLCLQYFLNCFLKKELSSDFEIQHKNRNSISFWSKYRCYLRGQAAALIFIIWEILEKILLEKSDKEKQIYLERSGYFIVSAVIVFFIAKGLFYFQSRLAMFIVITFFAVISLGSFLVHLIAQAGDQVSTFLLWCIRQGYLPEENSNIIMELTAVVFLILIYAALWAVVFFSLQKVAGYFPQQGYFLQKAEFLLLIMPGGIGILLCMLLRLVLFDVRENNGILLYDKLPATRLIIPAILFLVLWLVVYAVKLFDDMVSLNQEKNEKAVLKAQLAGMKEQVQQAEYVCAGIKELRHDIKSTFAVILQLSERGSEKTKDDRDQTEDTMDKSVKKTQEKMENNNQERQREEKNNRYNGNAEYQKKQRNNNQERQRAAKNNRNNDNAEHQKEQRNNNQELQEAAKNNRNNDNAEHQKEHRNNNQELQEAAKNNRNNDNIEHQKEQRNNNQERQEAAKNNRYNDNAEYYNRHKTYLEELGRRLAALEIKFHTGNMVADALLYAKWLELSKTLPELVFDVEELYFPEGITINAYDLGIILGNALDNAAEACQRMKIKDDVKVKTKDDKAMETAKDKVSPNDIKEQVYYTEKENIEESKVKDCSRELGEGMFIRLRSFQKKKMFFLEVENCFDGKLLKRKDKEFPTTIKKEKGIHGIGLSNIKRIAEKYQGAVDWSVKEDIFTLSVMIKCD